MKKNFRFFDNRQKYLLFVTTTNEKNKIADALKPIVNNLKPKNTSNLVNYHLKYSLVKTIKYENTMSIGVHRAIYGNFINTIAICSYSSYEYN